MLDARNFEMAAQAGLYQEYSVKGKTDKNPKYENSLKEYIDGVIGTDAVDKIDDVTITTDEKGTITELVYKSKDKYTATYKLSGDDAGWGIEPTSTSTPTESSAT